VWQFFAHIQYPVNAGGESLLTGKNGARVPDWLRYVLSS